MGNRSFFNALHDREGDFLLDGDPETDGGAYEKIAATYFGGECVYRRA